MNGGITMENPIDQKYTNLVAEEHRKEGADA